VVWSEEAVSFGTSICDEMRWKVNQKKRKVMEEAESGGLKVARKKRN
jgi:hypothetical protein